MEPIFLKHLVFPLRLACALAVCALVSACAAGGRPSTVPITTTFSPSGHVHGARAFESGGRLYVVGSLAKDRGRHIPHPAHIDVQLIDARGRVLAERRDDIDPAHPRSASGKSGRYTYVASFPIEDARRASKVVIRYHLMAHGS